MNNRSKNNSIIFLTTLSVYLGLVLVGGASSNVLAQAALTQRITEVQNKVEDSDDGDCKDDASNEVDELLRFDFVADGVLEFLESIQKISETDNDNYSFNFDYNFAFTDNRLLTTHSDDYNNSFHLAASQNLESLTKHLNSYYRYNEDLKKEASHSKIKFIYENGELIIKISSEKQSIKSAADFADLYNKAFEIGVCSKYTDEKPKIIYENTKATSKNNQVIIVTRLPRGSLDKLLKQDAKAK